MHQKRNNSVILSLIFVIFVGGIAFEQGNKNKKTMRYWISDWDFGSSGYKVVDEKDYDVIPKKHLVERQLKEAELAVENAKRIRDMALDSYTKRISELEEKVQELKRSLK